MWWIFCFRLLWCWVMDCFCLVCWFWCVWLGGGDSWFLYCWWLCWGCISFGCCVIVIFYWLFGLVWVYSDGCFFGYRLGLVLLLCCMVGGWDCGCLIVGCCCVDRWLIFWVVLFVWWDVGCCGICGRSCWGCVFWRCSGCWCWVGCWVCCWGFGLVFFCFFGLLDSWLWYRSVDCWFFVVVFGIL